MEIEQEINSLNNALDYFNYKCLKNNLTLQEQEKEKIEDNICNRVLYTRKSFFYVLNTIDEDIDRLILQNGNI